MRLNINITWKVRLKYAASKNKYAAFFRALKDNTLFFFFKYAAKSGIEAAYLRHIFKKNMSYLLCSYSKGGKGGICSGKLSYSNPKKPPFFYLWPK